MMGHGHASTVFCTGLVTGDALQLSPILTATLGVASAGAALLPDIDCKGSTASTVFGPFSVAAHHASMALHNMVAASLTDQFEEHRGGQNHAHRGLTHWWPFWIVCGAGVWAGCSIVGKWFVFGVLAILFALAARGLAIPDMPAETQGRFQDSLRHQWMMQLAYRVLLLCPFTLAMRRMRKHVARSRRYGWWVFTTRIGVGKVATAAGAAVVAFILTQQGTAAQIGPWLGLIVGVGMFLHWVGDCPTHMGVPGLSLFKFWKLPFWASFYAGGPFEIMCIWFPVGWLNLIMLPIPALRSFQMTVAMWTGIGLGAIIIALIVIEGTQATRRRRYAST